MVNVVVDTSVLIEEIRLGSDLWLQLKKESKLGKIKLISPSIVLTELWAGKSMSKKSNEKYVERMIDVVVVVDVRRELAKKAGEIIRKYKTVGFDAIIAATCFQYGAELATLNTKHFKMIKGLKLYK